MVNWCTKFEDTTFSRSKDRKTTQNINTGVIWGGCGHSRSSAMSPSDRAYLTSCYLPYNYVLPISYHFQDMIWLKSTIFSYLTCIWFPHWRWSHRIFVNDYIIKLESLGYHESQISWWHIQPFWYNTGTRRPLYTCIYRASMVEIDHIWQVSAKVKSAVFVDSQQTYKQTQLHT